MDSEQLRTQIGDYYRTILNLGVKGVFIPALVLTYSLIDTLAWLNRPETHEDVNWEDFQKWVDNYMKPEITLGCTSQELYAARCGIVHSHNAQSKLTRKKNVTELYYSIYPGTKDELDSIIKNHYPTRNSKAISIEDLFDVLYEGITLFLLEKGSDPLILDRASKFFRFLPK